LPSAELGGFSTKGDFGLFFSRVRGILLRPCHRCRWYSPAFWVLAVLATSCASAPVKQGGGERPGTEGETELVQGDSSCRLMHVGGDSRGVRSGPDSLVIAAEGVGLVVSSDGGRSFRKLASDVDLRWPAAASRQGRVWISWVSQGPPRVLNVAELGRGLETAVPVYSSRSHLIDTEILALRDGCLLLLVSEVDGRPNVNRATYRVLTFFSSDGGKSFIRYGPAVTGPRGINIEDPRLFELDNGDILLAYEWEIKEGGASKILLQRSSDSGMSWSAPSVLWGGRAADREPGSFFSRNQRLYFVASTDGGSGRSYGGARLVILESGNGGKTWRKPFVPIEETGQLAMGAIVLADRILLLSLRHYADRSERDLYLYPVDPLGLWPLSCAPVSVPPTD